SPLSACSRPDRRQEERQDSERTVASTGSDLAAAATRRVLLPAGATRQAPARSRGSRSAAASCASGGDRASASLGAPAGGHATGPRRSPRRDGSAAPGVSATRAGGTAGSGHRRAAVPSGPHVTAGAGPAGRGRSAGGASSAGALQATGAAGSARPRPAGAAGVHRGGARSVEPPPVEVEEVAAAGARELQEQIVDSRGAGDGARLRGPGLRAARSRDGAGPDLCAAEAVEVQLDVPAAPVRSDPRVEGSRAGPEV